MVVGAIVVNVPLEILRTPDKPTWVVYFRQLATLAAKLRPVRRLVAVLAGTTALGFAAHALAHAVDASWNTRPQGILGASRVEIA